MSAKPLTRIIVDFPADAAALQPALWRIIDAETGNQITTICELIIKASADGVLQADALHVDDRTEQFDIAGFRVT